jgi:hypothetical protein
VPKKAEFFIKDLTEAFGLIVRRILHSLIDYDHIGMHIGHLISFSLLKYF